MLCGGCHGDGTSADAGRRVEVVLMGAAVVLAFSKQQHLGRVAAGRADTVRVAGQALAVARCRKQGQHGRSDEM